MRKATKNPYLSMCTRIQMIKIYGNIKRTNQKKRGRNTREDARKNCIKI